MNEFINVKSEACKTRDKLLLYLKEEWHFGVDDVLLRSHFYDMLSRLVENEFNLLKICVTGVQRIVIHPLYEIKIFSVSNNPLE